MNYGLLLVYLSIVNLVMVLVLGVGFELCVVVFGGEVDYWDSCGERWMFFWISKEGWIWDINVSEYGLKSIGFEILYLVIFFGICVFVFE